MQNDDHAGPEPAGAAWGTPLYRLDVAWQGIEAWLCAAVLIAEIASLTLWVMLRGLATDNSTGSGKGGIVSRALIAMVVFGVGAHLATRKRGEKVNARRRAARSSSGWWPARCSGTPATGGRRTSSTGCRTRRAHADRRPPRPRDAPDALGRAARRVARVVARQAHPRRRHAALRPAASSATPTAIVELLAAAHGVRSSPRAASSTTSRSPSSR